MAGEEVRTDSAPSTNMQQEQNVLFARSTNVAAIQTDMEDLRVHTSDHPGMVLVADPLVGSNYLLWSRSVRVALTAKMKLSFIDGSYPKPAEGTGDFKQWLRTDSMVFSWIMNCISKDISKAFYYAKSARRLWLDLESRFGQSNGPMIYNLQRQIASISQGNMDVVSYYTKLRLLWDELECIDPNPDCDCSSQRTLANKLASNQLMQFLMGLNDSFDAIRNQILVMDPLPVVDKAYSLVLRVESQRQGQMHIEEANTNAALLAKNMDVTRDVKQFQKKKTFVDKKNQFCDHCNKSGHSRNACFKLHGYPEWFKEYSEQRKKNIGETKALLAKCENNRVQPNKEGLELNKEGQGLELELEQ
ncbi:UNVERIFIED_CONTAM: hypothetical protein Sradi_1152100 [Sesamum radiatum]|uniref:Retrotransposon Copia-like N-terminal domain-containing protein n=1 Tax=Sesamum radiatum TaxID=300843 RepID=A0AAW2VAM1_SESRA